MIGILVANFKGGVSKTTTAAALASGLKKRGYRILSVDLDAQGNLTTSAGLVAEAIPLTVRDLLEKKDSFDDVVIEDTTIGDLIACNLNLIDADRVFTRIGDHKLLKKALSAVEDRYDFAIMDCPPYPGIMAFSGMTATKYVIIPVNAAAFSIQGVDYLNTVTQMIREDDNPNQKDLGILITRYNPRTRFGKEASEAIRQIAESMGTTVFNSTIRQAVAVEESQAQRQDILTAAPTSRVAQDYESFVDEVLERLQAEGEEIRRPE